MHARAYLPIPSVYTCIATAVLLISASCVCVDSFVVVSPPPFASSHRPTAARISHHLAATSEGKSSDDDSGSRGAKKDNKAMKFLRKVGRVGGTKDFINAVGSDEGPAEKAAGPSLMTKAPSAFRSCVDSGTIDDMSENFPYTSCGTAWRGFTDQVMGGVSYGRLEREQEVEGRTANVLHGKVSLYNNGGFVQMATDLSLDPFVGSVDASAYDGIELDVLCQGNDDSGSFNVHLRNPACARQNSSYRATFEIESGKGWKTVRLSWKDFKGFGPGPESTPFDVTELRRLGIVAIGRKIEDLNLALAGLRLYSA